MLEVTFPRHGAVLNHNNGLETAGYLEIEVHGLYDGSGRITVNGREAERDGMSFTGRVRLSGQFNTIRIAADDEFGISTKEIKTVWDKASFPRYEFFVDDHIFFLRDLAQDRRKSIFDQFYLGFWKKMHEKYGQKICLNCFYEDCHHKGFNLSQMPDCYKAEFEDNADWLRLAFHARGEFPDRPYQNCTPDVLAADYDLVMNELVRFAGSAYIPAPVSHWAIARPESLKVLTDRGMRACYGQFCDPRTAVGDTGSNAETVCDIGYFRNASEALYLQKNHLMYNFRHNLCFHTAECVCNLSTKEEIRAALADLVNDPVREVGNVMSHEQYAFKDYFNYEPDIFDRLETACSYLHENGYRSVFFQHGFLGNMSWER